MQNQSLINPIRSCSLKGERKLARAILTAAIEDHQAKLARQITDSSSLTAGMKRQAQYLFKRLRELHDVRVAAKLCRGYLDSHRRDLIPEELPEFRFLRTGIHQITWRPTNQLRRPRAAYRALWAMLHQWLGLYEQREEELLEEIKAVLASIEADRQERAVIDPTAFLFSDRFGASLKFWSDLAGTEIDYLRRKICNYESRVNLRTIGDQARALMAGQ